MVINLLLSGLKFAGGTIASSQALIADAFHSLSDTVTDLIVIIGVRFWQAPPDTKHPYGHGRIETVAALLIGTLLGAVGIGLAYNAISDINKQQSRTIGWTAFTIACLSIVLKEIIYRYTIAKARKIKSSALAANAWHHRSDALSSVPVALAAAVNRLTGGWEGLDSIAAVIVSLMIVQAAWRIVKPALEELVDAGLDKDHCTGISKLAQSVDGVVETHALRSRKLGSGIIIDLHVLVNANLTVAQGHEIATNVKHKLMNGETDILDVIVHIEPA
ncbi:Ferrous-iron efflux pump FieF [Limihaloglobus sulfuriphilus]|uniref:Ferrous-iron efflux pump FieF n=2 Tax=Limihaloglobus sulfuriphilus TaxID=1851148 RepID=A0A1Q2MF34_9BACT|nr:Ferrous-iron efflux pump FieF [Limihaloglobus sulfuriphilus]